ncbi:hypothetical protein L1987_62771 [Smallanthus sonchifolius]|uniref:Uncharacterized protein n=1 Tax=Smallanthus sonchifolius TaxID=185202 RepID=A0ACB9CBB0_9ASTR|nr:hypothetical protein L1987_62771 [Smallanthus sonchifolius]
MYCQLCIYSFKSLFSLPEMAFSQIIKRSTPTLDSLHSSISVSIHTKHISPSLHLHPRNFCNKTLDASNHQIITESDKLCKIISNHRDRSQLESLLNSTQIELSPALVIQVLKKLSNAGVFALSFFRWAEKQTGFKHTSDTYNVLIEALGKIKQFKIIWTLVNDMKIKGVLDKTTFALISRRYARAKKVKEAIEAFERMEKFGFKPELSDRFLDTLCKSRQVESAHQVFDKMTKRKEMKGNGFEPDVVAYGIIINAYCKARKYDHAIKKFDEMKVNNMEPTPHIYCTLINGLGSKNRLSESLMFFEMSKSCGHGIEAPTYNAVVGSYCWSMRMDDAFRVVEEMKRCGVGPNSRTFDIILHHLVKGRRIEEAYSVFKRMKDDFKCDPSVSTYEIMVRMFCNEGKMDIAMSVWEEMKGEGILPGMHMFATLINGLCREKKLQDACRYFEEMLDMGIRPPTHMFNKLKQGLVDEGKEDIVMILTHRLEKLKTLLVVS